MNIEIDHRHPLQAASLERMQGAGRHRIEQAKTHRLINAGVMAGRAHGAEGASLRAGQDRIDCLDHRAHGAQRSLRRILAHCRIGIDPPIAGRGNVEHLINQARAVGQGQGRTLSGARLLPQQIGKRLTECFNHCLQTCRGLGVPGAGLVFNTDRMGIEQHACGPEGQAAAGGDRDELPGC